MSIRPDFHTELAQLFIDELLYQRSNFYYFVGKIDPWPNVDDVPPEGDIDLSLLEETKVRENLMYVKKIRATDVSLVCKSYSWSTGTVFDRWDHTQNMVNKQFYCITDEFKVYKCLDNNGAVPSTVKPFGNSVYPIKTTDGYLWKYMYTVPIFKRSRFISAVNIPVQRAISDSFFNRGAVDAVVVTNPGSGYIDVLLTTISVSGTTTGSGAVATISSVGLNGEITGITVNNGGTGYTRGARLRVVVGTGSGAVLTATFVDGVITAITATNPGFGYEVGQAVQITVGGAQLIPKVSRVTGSIDSVIIQDPGYGYVSAPTLTVNGTGLFPGDGLYENNTSAILQAIVDAGSIVRVNLVDPGKDYPADTATTISVQGDGEGAAFSPVVIDGELVDVVIENRGSGYTNIILQVVGAGTGASAIALIGQSDFASDQAVIEQSTSPGAIYAVGISNQGFGYSGSTTVTITGDGTGCTAECTVADGAITKVQIITPGVDYTYGIVTFNDTTGSGAQAYVILPPKDGHGKDAVRELYADSIVFNTALKDDLGVYNLDQYFRQFGILKNPRVAGTTDFFTQQSEVVLLDIQFVSAASLVVGEVLIKDNYRYRVAYINGNVVGLQNLSRSTVAPIGTMVIEGNPLRVYTSTSVIDTPSLNKYSGVLIYANNSNPFTFNEDQGIIVRTFISF